MRLRDIIGILLLAALAAACSADVDFFTSEGEGHLHLDISNVSAITRATPEELGVPAPEDFHLRIVNKAGRAVYEGSFTSQELTLPTGNYSIIATYGTNPLLGIDTPYYIADATATIVKEETTQVQLHAAVGNALVSVNFGRDEAEQSRFDRFYSDYALYVHVGSYSIPITKEKNSESIYLQAGQHATLSFWGKLKFENDREVAMDLESNDFPTTLEAADHAIVTLSLPDPESALTVDIIKVTLENVTLEETIPLSWLPVPTVTPVHRYASNGNLIGTDLTFSNSYVGMNWRAVVSNASGTDIRLVQGTGELLSDYTSSSSWPYLPQGKYKASFYIISDDDKAKLASTREFLVQAPAISVIADGYTSYDKYLTGDIETANACERLTVYEPSAKLNVSPSLLTNSNYSYTFTYTYDGATGNVPAGINYYAPGNLTEQAVQREPHVLRIDATFDGVSATDQADFIITGLPYSLDLNKHDEWDESGGVDWFENDVRLGHLSTGSQYIQTTSSICLPPATYFCADYSVNVHTLTVGTYLSISAGQTEILHLSESGTPFRDTDHLYSGTTDAFHDDDTYITLLRCYNDYGAGQTCSHIYSLTLKYANH
ncbi:MAG: DUF4493 domain-containing protein [Bacteroidaceae bacterium]|nr:DUF4493 domain-containing protein [Bacteroidaceae bacterium]